MERGTGLCVLDQQANLALLQRRHAATDDGIALTAQSQKGMLEAVLQRMHKRGASDHQSRFFVGADVLFDALGQAAQGAGHLRLGLEVNGQDIHLVGEH